MWSGPTITVSLICLMVFYRADASRYYAYISTPMTVNDAESYCLTTFNRHLATILTESDMIDAVSTIAGRAAPWIGLHNVKQEAGWFEYFNNEQCPTDTIRYGACLGKEFWTEGKPRHCGSEEECSSCVTLYTDSDHSDGYGKINNDIKCQELQPFLCDTTPRQYTYSETLGNWNDAYNYCLTRGGLASFVTEYDINNLQKVIDATGYHFAWIALAQHSVDEVDQNWYWLDDTPCVVADDLCTDLWSVGEPNAMPGHAWCECQRSGCRRSGCIRSGCVRTGSCTRKCVRRVQDDNDCQHGGGHHCHECIEWQTVCGCEEYGCVETGCLDYGCVEYQCYTEDADCAAVESLSGLAADYHCTTNYAPIICNDESIINIDSAQFVSPYLLPELDETGKVLVLGLLKNEDFVRGMVVLLVMSCMVNICLCVRCGCRRHQMSKVEYESVGMDEMKNINMDK